MPARSRGLHLAALSALLVVACAGTKPGPVGPGFSLGPGAATLPPQAMANAVLFDPWQITDPFANGIVAVTYLVPSGWQSSGQVVWTPEWSRLADLQTIVSDPVSGATVEWLPLQDFIFGQAPVGLEPPIGANYQGKMWVPPVTDPVQFVNDFWLSGSLAHLSGATLTSIEQVPRVADEFIRAFGGAATAAAYRLRYTFVQNGQTWEEVVNFALLYSTGPAGDSWYVNFAYTMRAPQGVLDELAPVLSTIVASRNTTPEWAAVHRLTQQLFTQGIQQQMADTAAFGRLLAEQRAQTDALQQQIVAERQQSQDRIAEMRGEVLSGVQSFQDPLSGQTVQLPAGQGTYWVNNQGQYFASDQPGFDPNSLGGGWTQLQPRQF
jgi:hypothetical protein